MLTVAILTQSLVERSTPEKKSVRPAVKVDRAQHKPYCIVTADHDDVFPAHFHGKYVTVNVGNRFPDQVMVSEHLFEFSNEQIVAQ